MAKSLFNFYLDDGVKKRCQDKLERLLGKQEKGALAALIRTLLEEFDATPDDKVEPLLKDAIYAEYIEKVKYIMNKAAILMKSGSMIIGEEEVAKIFANFRTELSMEELQDARDSTSVYISGIDAKRMMDYPEDFVQFGDTLLESNALEAFSSLNPEKLPKLAYVGEYNKEEKRIKVNRRIDRYYDRLNETLVPTKPSDDGR